MSEALYPTDHFDRVINVGDILVYPVRGGSSMWLSHARVLGIRAEKSYYSNGREHSILDCEVMSQNTTYLNEKDPETGKWHKSKKVLRKTRIECHSRAIIVEGSLYWDLKEKFDTYLD